MSMIDIDKLFRDLFHKHENSSSVYTPDRWKDFEKMLDKNLPADKKGGFRLNLNNWLVFFSCTAIVVIVPLLLLQSKDVRNSSTVSGRTLLMHKNVVSDKGSPNENRKEKHLYNSAIALPGESKEFNQVVEKIPEKINQNGGNSSAKTDVITFNNEADVKENNTGIKEVVQINPTVLSTAIAEKDSAIVEQKNGAGTVDTNLKSNSKNGKNKKPGKIKRSGVLVPHVDYNGL